MAITGEPVVPERQFMLQRPKDRGRPLRVVIVAPRIQHSVGGQEVQADLLVRLWRDDPALHVSYAATNLQLARWLERVPYLRTVVRFPLYVTELLGALREADLAHIFSASFSSFLISTLPAFCVARLLGKRVLVNYRSGLAKTHLSASWLARSVLRKADKVVVPSSYLVNVFREFHIEAQAIPNVIDLRLFSYRARDPLRPLLLCSRNLETCYGIDLVIRAFAEVQKVFPDARLWVLGEGSQENAIRRLVAELNLSGVEMTGRVPRENVGSFYDKADILINGSRVDNMPVSILEAYASSLPVVTTDAGGIPYIVRHEHTALMSGQEDWRQLAANVIRLLQDSTLARQLIENAYQRSFSYHWSGAREYWLRLYQKLDQPALIPRGV